MLLIVGLAAIMAGETAVHMEQEEALMGQNLIMNMGIT